MSRRRAISLFEVVVAMVIMGLAIPPLFIQIAADVQQQRAFLVQRNLTRLASDRMWEIFTDHAESGRGYDYVEDSAYPDESDVEGLSGYSRSTEVIEVNTTDFISPQTDSGVKRFKVAVNGPDGRVMKIESFVVRIPGSVGDDDEDDDDD